MDGLRISYLYLNKYRTIQRVGISFDHRFVVHNNGNWYIRYEKEDMLAGPYFYGDKVYSMSCIVGRNGEGKTSLVNFIHESFLHMMKDIGNGGLSISPDSHKVELSDLDCTFYHIERETEFLIVFSMNGNDYYLTSIESVKADEGIKPYSREIAKNTYLDQSSVTYFSMIRLREGVTGTERHMGRILDEPAILKRGLKQENARDNFYLSIPELFGSYKVDLSEERFDKIRSNDGNDNLDILMQLVFIHYQNEMVEECLGKDFSSRMMINSFNFDNDKLNNEGVRGILEGDGGEVQLEKILLAFQDGVSYLWPFSSGQYTRFALLARLYWFLEGSTRFLESPFFQVFSSLDEYRRIEDRLFKRPLDSVTDAILLFDEGDLCYHPEWQRKFVNDILKAVNKFAHGEVQIIFTTNSPFMMSDMLREDIVTLARDKPGFDENTLTFGQNIHTLLAHRFFLDSTIGEVSESTIDWLIGLLSQPDEDDSEEEEYVNRSVYKRFKAYCELRGMDEFSDKSKFIESLIANIGEEVYRKKLYVRYKSYKGRIAKYHKNAAKDKIEKLIELIKQYENEEDDQALQLLKQKLQEMADQGEI